MINTTLVRYSKEMSDADYLYDLVLPWGNQMKLGTLIGILIYFVCDLYFSVIGFILGTSPKVRTIIYIVFDIFAVIWFIKELNKFEKKLKESEVK